MRLVEDDGVVGAEPRIGLRFREQDAVGHELDQRGADTWSVKRTWNPTRSPTCCSELARDTARDRSRRDATRLRAADHSCDAAPRGKAQLRQLRRLSRTGFAGEHDDLMRADQAHDLVGLRGDRQRFVDANLGHALRARRPSRCRRFDLCTQGRELALRRLGMRRRKPPPARQQASEVARHHVIERVAKGFEVGHRIGVVAAERAARPSG